jgi:hypothetical protein
MVVHLDGKVTGDYVLETPAARGRLSVSAGTGDAGCRHLPGGLSAAGRPDSKSAGSRDHERHDVTRASRQRVCGIVTNERPNVVRTEYDALRAMLHNSAIHGPATQNRQAVPDFRAHLLCRITWIAALTPREAKSSTANSPRSPGTTGRESWTYGPKPRPESDRRLPVA